MSPQSMEEAGGGGGRSPGVPGDLAVSPAEGGEVGAHADAGGSTEVAAGLRGQTGGSPRSLLVKRECFLRGTTQGKSPLLQTSLLSGLDEPPVDRVHSLLLFVLLRRVLSLGPHTFLEERGGGGRQEDGSLS